MDLTCPAEVFQVSPPTEEHPAAELTLFNLSGRVIVSAEVTLKLQNARGVDLERATVLSQGLNGRPHSTFRISLPCNPHPGAEKTVVLLEKIRFIDLEEWTRQEGGETEYTPNDLPVSPALTHLKFVAGETAKGFPSQQDGLWVCVCGRPNPDELAVCARCRQPKETVFARYNRDAVETRISQRERQLDLATRSTREDLARMQRVREAEYREKESRKKRRIRRALWLAVILALLAGLFFLAEPALRRFLPPEPQPEESFPETLSAATITQIGAEMP